MRVITTHLEWYSAAQRAAQVERCAASTPTATRTRVRPRSRWREDGGPFQTFLRPRATVICGDFNLEHVSDLHARMVGAFDDGTPALVNSWDLLHPGRAVSGDVLHLQPRWRTTASCTATSSSRAPRRRSAIERFFVDQQTQASDHQPIVLTLRWMQRSRVSTRWPASGAAGAGRLHRSRLGRRRPAACRRPGRARCGATQNVVLHRARGGRHRAACARTSADDALPSSRCPAICRCSRAPAVPSASRACTCIT